MKKIINKKMLNKILILLLIVVSFNFISPTISNAVTGGELLEPVANLLTSLGDGILNIVHKFVMQQDVSILHSSSGIWEVILSALIIIGVAIVLIAVPIGLGIPALSMGAVLLISGTVGVLTYNGLSKSMISLPVYSISPEEVFMNKIALLDVNFFNPEANESEYEETYTETKTLTGNIGSILSKYGHPDYPYSSISEDSKNASELWAKYTTQTEVWNYNGTKYTLIRRYTETGLTISYDYINFYIDGQLKEKQEGNVMAVLETNLDQKVYENAEYGYSEAKSEADKLSQSTNINDYSDYITSRSGGNTYIEWKDAKDYKHILVIKSNGEKELRITTPYINSSSSLQPIVAKWYVTLRNIALVISMSILVYVGIRMMLSSAASQKAKYKNMLFDWLIGVGLIFVMQYIMVFAVSINNELVELIASSENYTPKYRAAIQYIDEKGNKNNAVEKVFNKYAELKGIEVPANKSYAEISANDEGYIGYETNLMGNVRLLIQNSRDESLSYVGYVIMFLVLVFYTVAFLFIYIRRVMYMALLTILAPFVAMTYSIDKLTDGQAQAFNMWIKEYLFNLLIQPMHLLLYYILVSSAIELATTETLYGLVALGFLLPAEKVIRRFFGFDKAKTSGILNGAAGAGIVMSAVGSLRRFASPGKDGGSKGGSSKDNTGKIRTKDKGASLSLNDTNFNDMVSQAEQQSEREIRRQQDLQSVSIKMARERLEELKAEGFGEGDREYDEAKKELDKYIVEAAESRVEVSRDIERDAEETIEQELQAEQEEQDNQGESRTRSRRILGAMGGVAQGLARGGVRLTGKIPGLAARGFGAATLGAVGLAAGIATGDPNSALKYTLAGGAAGSALGAGLANRASSAFGSIADDAIRGFYGEDYDKYVNSQSDREFLANKEIRDEYKSEFGSSYKDRMQDALEYRKYGITDNKIIMRAMNLPSKFGGSNVKSKERLYIAQLASQISSRSDLARLRETFVRKGIQPSKIDTIEEGIRRIKKWD